MGHVELALDVNRLPSLLDDSVSETLMDRYGLWSLIYFHNFFALQFYCCSIRLDFVSNQNI